MNIVPMITKGNKNLEIIAHRGIGVGGSNDIIEKQ